METVQSGDGTAIAFDRSGDGPALVLVAGAFCDQSTFKPLAALLARDFTVYTYDRRGRGSSGDTPPYSVDREIEDLDAVITAAGGSTLVFGHSSGAVLALEAAARGLAIPKLAPYEPPYSVEDTEPPPVSLLDRVSGLIASGQRGEAAKLFLIHAGVPDESVAIMQASPTWADMEAIAHTLPYDLTIVGDGRIPADRLAKIPVPTLVLGGADSPDWFRSTVLAVADVIPDAQHVLLGGQTHMFADDVLAPVLAKFFSE